MIDLDRTHLPDRIPVVVACSGGADSLALLYLMAEAAPDHGWSLTVAHLDHGLRPEAGADADFVVVAAGGLGLPVTVQRVAVPQVRRPGESLEAAARRVRYGFLREVSSGLGPRTRIVTGHTADDQLETLALRLQRGSALRGWRGILAVRSDGVVRPLLAVRGEDLRDWLRSRGARWREDATNRDLRIPRNRVRVAVGTLPSAVREEALAAAGRLAGQAAGLHPLLERLAALRPRLGGTADPGARLPDEFLLERFSDPVHLDVLGPACLDATLAEAGVDPRSVTSRTRRALHGALHPDRGNDPAGVVQVGPGVWAERRPEGLLLVAGPGPDWAGVGTDRWPVAGPFPLPDPPARLSLPRGGMLEVTVAPAAWTSLLVRGERPPTGRDGTGETGKEPLPDGRGTTVVTTRGPGGRPVRLMVRYPRRGDRLVPFGMTGSRLLSDLFGEAGVPRLRRARLPVVEGPAGIVWVGGVRTAEAARVSEPDEPALTLRFIPEDPTRASGGTGGASGPLEGRP